MASLQNFYPPKYLDQAYDWYFLRGDLNTIDVWQLNRLSRNSIIVVDNTKGLDPKLLAQIKNPNILFNVMGGLDYLKKRKYRDMDYIERALFKPEALIKIISYFEKIERGIRYTWTDRQKSLYVYKKILESMHYKKDNEKDYENGQNVVRSLSGLLYGKLVCAGFAMVFKEAMDRLGINCEYQNRKSKHAWNVVTLDGKKYALDLTFDVAQKSADNGSSYENFCQDPNFYKNKHHDLSEEPDERVYDISTISREELLSDYKVISSQGNVRKAPMEKVVDKFGDEFHYLKIGEKNGLNTFVILYKNLLTMVYSKEADLKNTCVIAILGAIKSKKGYLGKDQIPDIENKTTSYIREDGSQFMVIATGNAKSNIKEYYYYDTETLENEVVFRRAVILSESDLNCELPNDTKKQVADKLLSKERMARKINHYNGYVGFLCAGQLVSNRDFEYEDLNIKTRL